jgi:sulfur-carrier protein
MTVSVLLFASYAEALGSNAIEMAPPPGASVGWVVEQLRRLPGGGDLPPNPLVAVNMEYVGASRELRAGDEVAVIPPVAGG